MNIEGWKVATIEECCEILDSKRIPINAEERETRIGDIPYYGANGLQGYIDDYIFDEELILIAEDGGCFDEFATRPIAYKISGKSWVNNHAHILRAKQSYSQDYIFYSLEHKDIQPFIVGGTRAKLNQFALRSIKLILPELEEEQEQIAEILSTIDRAIAQTEAIIAKQQRIKTGLMQDLLTKGIDENGNIRSEATHEFKDSAIGRIPIEWEVETIGKIASLQRGHDIREVEFIAGDYPVIASSGVIGFHNIKTSDSPNVVVGRKGSIGNVYYLDVDFWAHDTSLYVTNFFGNNQKYIYYLFLYLELERFGTKSGSPSLNRNDIHPLKISLPKPMEQERISKMLSHFDTSISNLKSGLNKLQHQKTGLMQDLLTGKVRVTNLLKEREPASL
ncbi:MULTISPECIES: restriction endonuclease subunit S [Planktothrix]|uniref:restriction endonuclease subunit S n=1 Tax=Planktothrix TaxID=54304 RepID=UPI00040D2B3A|nr:MULTISPECIES: restriction endonuclease subunit S [Planktothrix]